MNKDGILRPGAPSVRAESVANRFNGSTVVPLCQYDRGTSRNRCESLPVKVRPHFPSPVVRQTQLQLSCSATAQHTPAVLIRDPTHVPVSRASISIASPAQTKSDDVARSGYRTDFKPVARLVNPQRPHMPTLAGKTHGHISVGVTRLRVSPEGIDALNQTKGHNVSAPSCPSQTSTQIDAHAAESKLFLTAASVCEQKQKALRNIFEVYGQERDGKKLMGLPQFYAFLETYSLCDSAVHVGPFFHAFNRRRTEYLSMEDFIAGCVAADVSTQHVGFVGENRWRYVLDFYDHNYSGKLEAEEFKVLLADAKMANEEPSGSPRVPDIGRLAEIDHQYLQSLASSNKISGDDLFRFYTDFLTTLTASGETKFSIRDADLKGSPTSADGADSDTNATTCATTDMADRVLSGAVHGGWSGSEILAPEDFSEALEYESCEAMLMHECQQWRWWGPTLTELATLPAPPSISWNPRTPTSLPAKPLPKDSPTALESAKHVVATILESGDIDNELFTTLSPEEIFTLCDSVCQKLRNEPNVVEKKITSSVKIFGSLHGQLSDLLSYFHYYNRPHAQLSNGDLVYTHYVFMGDFVDFGPKSLEVVLLLFSLYLLHPTHITLLRGLHECSHVNYYHGFHEECMRRTNSDAVYVAICNVFEYLSLAAILRPPTSGTRKYSTFAKGIVCMPTGLPSKLRTLKTLDVFKKPNRLDMKSAYKPIDQWLELSHEMFAFPPNPTIPSKDLKRFCDENDVRTVIQSRFCPRHGVLVREHGRNIVVSSAVAHAGAFLHLRRDEQFYYSEPGTPVATAPDHAHERISSVQARIRALEQTRSQTPVAPEKKSEPCFTFRLHPQCLVAHPVSISQQKLLRVGPIAIPPRTEHTMWLEHSKRECVVLGATLLVVESNDDPAPALPLSTLKRAQSLTTRDCAAVSAMTSPSPCRFAQGTGRISIKDDKTPSSRGEKIATSMSTVSVGSSAQMSVDVRSQGPRTSQRKSISKKDLFGIQILQEAREMSTLTLNQLKDPTNAKWLYGQWRETMSSSAYLHALMVFSRIAKMGLRCDPYIDKTGLGLWLFKEYKIPVSGSHRWFHAFDFNQDGKVCASDFLFGLLASSRKNSCAIIRAIGLMRFYSADSEARNPKPNALPQLEMREFVELTSDCKAGCTDAYPAFRFPMDLEAFTSLTINTEKIFSIKWE